MNYLSNHRWLPKLSLYGFVLISALVIYGYRFPGWDDYINVVPILNRLDPELYSQDFAVLEGRQFTPRFYYHWLIILMTKVGLSIPYAHFFYYVIAFFSFILGLYAIGTIFGKSKLSAAVLAFLSLQAVGGTVGYVDLFRPGATPAILAMGLSIWGVYWGFRKRWLLAYLMFGLACLVHFLVGLLPGLMMASLLILESFQRKNLHKAILPLFILIAFASLIYIPMLLTGTTSTGQLSSQEFVYLYGYLRVPHHIIPSAFPIQTWRNFIFFVIASILCIKTSDSLDSKNKVNFVILIGTSLLALLIGYVFVEVYPISLVAKLQLARTTPFAQLVGLIAISCLVNEQYKQKNFAISVLLLITPITKNGSLWLLLVVIGFITLKAMNRLYLLRSHKVTWIAITGSLLLLGLYPPPSSSLDLFNRIFWNLALFVILALPFIVEEVLEPSHITKRFIYALGFSSVLYFALGLFQALPASLSKFWQDKMVINEVPQSPHIKLALRFRQESAKDALILVPPSRTDFRFYSQRSVVFDFRTSSITDEGLKEWYKRMNTILGSVENSNPRRRLDQLFSQRSSTELVFAARKFNANYILTQNNWHPDIQGKLVDQEGPWVIYDISSTQQ